MRKKEQFPLFGIITLLSGGVAFIIFLALAIEVVVSLFKNNPVLLLLASSTICVASYGIHKMRGEVKISG